jgi:hypothetical protein
LLHFRVAGLRELGGRKFKHQANFVDLALSIKYALTSRKIRILFRDALIRNRSRPIDADCGETAEFAGDDVGNSDGRRFDLYISW